MIGSVLSSLRRNEVTASVMMPYLYLTVFKSIK